MYVGAALLASKQTHESENRDFPRTRNQLPLSRGSNVSRNAPAYTAGHGIRRTARAPDRKGSAERGWGIESEWERAGKRSFNTMRKESDGSCFWHRLTDPEWEREKAKVEQMLQDGDIEATKRKVQSDKNTKKRRESPEREAQATRSRANKSKARRVWNEESEEETEKETETVKAKKKKSKKRSRAEGDDRNRDEPPKKKKRTSKSSKSASDNPDRFQEMQKKLRTLAKAKHVLTQLPPVVRGSRRPGPPGVRATPEELASVR
ncbi:hypothetical protein C8F04DRAFT_1203218 [Mycena alexandri]|uniref:Uncharacterized protein n=1 Tax=Mycena alexandri TaxID=1745969 RepID=A0AAD6RWB0_9AGAR|nr:hypothetical protein C8F04DRAFT_1203218 [Mycena alexandri]